MASIDYDKYISESEELLPDTDSGSDYVPSTSSDSDIEEHVEVINIGKKELTEEEIIDGLITSKFKLNEIDDIIYSELHLNNKEIRDLLIDGGYIEGEISEEELSKEDEDKLQAIVDQMCEKCAKLECDLFKSEEDVPCCCYKLHEESMQYVFEEKSESENSESESESDELETGLDKIKKLVQELKGLENEEETEAEKILEKVTDTKLLRDNILTESFRHLIDKLPNLEPDINKMLESNKLNEKNKIKLVEQYLILANIPPLTDEYILKRQQIFQFFKEKSSTHIDVDKLKEIKGIKVEQSMKERIINCNTSIENKKHMYKKYKQMNGFTIADSDHGKLKNWLDFALQLPHNNTTEFNCDDKQKFIKYVYNCLNEELYGLQEVKEQILLFLNTKLNNPNSKGCGIGLMGPPGVGKCFELNTPILMYDGTIKMVQDIKEGDVLMGDDSTPRNVLALGSGKDDMYSITNIKGESYTVNSEHILCLKYSNNKRIKKEKNRFRVVSFNNKTIKLETKSFSYNENNEEEIYYKAKNYLENIEENLYCEITVKKYLELSNSMKIRLKGYSTTVDFDEKDVEIDPYLLGLWLGDGTSREPEITNQDSVIIKYLKEYLPEIDCYLQHHDNYTYRINGFTRKENKMLKFLRQNNLINNKHIPHHFKCNSRENRLRLLAGLIDSDGYKTHSNCLSITQCKKHINLMDDIIYLCRSLGFACYKKGKLNGNFKSYTINISGKGLNNIPLLINRKQIIENRKQIKDVLVSDIIVKKEYYGNYYGFMIDGNEKFVLGNFIVTHNTCIARTLAKILDYPFTQISFGGVNDAAFLKGHDFTYVGSKPGEIAQSLIRLKSKNGILFLDEFDKISDKNEIVSSLLHITDPEQNSEYRDSYMPEIKIDLSSIWWIYSMNEMPKNQALSDRLFIIEIPGYTITDKVHILQQHSIKKINTELGLQKEDIIINDDACKYLINYVSESKDKGVRKVQKALNDIIQKIIFLQSYGTCSINPTFNLKKDVVFPYEITSEDVSVLLKRDDKKMIMSMYS